MKNNIDLLKDVQEALAKNESFKNCLTSIYVLVNDGAVTLAGSVNTAQLKNFARKIVAGVPGVSLLIEDLKVEAIPSHRVGVQIDWASGKMAIM